MKDAILIRLKLIALFVLIHIGQAVISATWAWSILVRPRERGWAMMQGYDLFANTAFNGRARQYISTRAYLGMMKGSRGWTALCWVLCQIQPNHCRLSYEAERDWKLEEDPTLAEKVAGDPIVAAPRFDSVPLSNQPTSQ